MPTPRPAHRLAALLPSACLLALAACHDPVGTRPGALEPGVYDALEWDVLGFTSTAVAAQLTILPDGGYRFLERSRQLRTIDDQGDYFYFSDALRYTRTARETTFPEFTPGVSGRVAWVRGDTIALAISGGDSPDTARFVRRAATTERARIMQLFTTSPLFVQRVVRIVPITRTAAEMTYAPAEVDVGPRVRAALDANGVYWSRDAIADVLRVEAPPGWEVAGTVVRPPPREERATIAVRADDATATYPLVALRDLRTVPFQLTFGCVGLGQNAPLGSPMLDSVRVLASARINFQDPGTSSFAPLPFTNVTYTGSEIRYLTGGGVDTAAVTRTVSLDHQAPDTLYARNSYSGDAARHMVAQPGRPLRYVGGSLCDFGYAGFRPAEMTEVLP